MNETPSPHPVKQRLGGRNLYLVGMMASGKSSTGRPLAEQLSYGFVDTDAVIEQLAGQPIQKIFNEEGEEGFRAILGHDIFCGLYKRCSYPICDGRPVWKMLTRPFFVCQHFGTAGRAPTWLR